MLRTDPRNRARTTRAKAKVNHPRVGDTSELLASEGRERVSFATSLGIVRGGRDPRDMGHHSPNHQWDSQRHSSFLLTPVPRCYTSTY